MIRILPEQHHLDLIERTLIESTKNIPPLREDLLGGILLPHEVGQRIEVKLLKLSCQYSPPSFFNSYLCHKEKSESTEQSVPSVMIVGLKALKSLASSLGEHLAEVRMSHLNESTSTLFRRLAT